MQPPLCIDQAEEDELIKIIRTLSDRLCQHPPVHSEYSAIRESAERDKSVDKLLIRSFTPLPIIHLTLATLQTDSSNNMWPTAKKKFNQIPKS